MKQTESRQLRYQRERRARGKCISCGATAEKWESGLPKSRCSKCLKAHTVRYHTNKNQEAR